MLAQGAYQEAPGVKVDYNHLSAFVHSNDEFDFIQGLIYFFLRGEFWVFLHKWLGN